MLDLLSVILLFAVAFGWGALLLPASERDAEMLFLRAVVGIAAVSQVTFVLGLLSLLRPVLLLGVLCLGAAAGLRGYWRATPYRSGLDLSAGWPLPLWATVLTAGIGAGHVWRALQGDHGADPYHAVIPKAFLLAESLRPFDGVAESTYSMTWELISIPAFAVVTGEQPALITAVALILAAAGVALLLRNEGRLAPTIGCLALTTNPLLVLTAGSSHIECGQALFLIAALVAGFRFRREGSRWSLFVAAGLLGTVAGTKETAVVLVVLPALAIMFWPVRERWRTLGRRSLVVALVLVSAAPLLWATRKTVATGNPIYPLAVSRLHTKAVYHLGAERFDAQHAHVGGDFSLKSTARRLRDLADNAVAEPVFGVFAALVLISPLVRRRWGALLGGAVCALLTTPMTPTGQMRFFAPSTVFLVIAMAILVGGLLDRAQAVSPQLARVATICFIVILTLRYPLRAMPLCETMPGVFRPAPLTLGDRQARALENEPHAELLMTASEVFGADDRILVVSGPRRLEFLDVPFIPPSHFVWDLREAYSSAGIDLGRDLGITAVLLLEGTESLSASKGCPTRTGSAEDARIVRLAPSRSPSGQ